MTEVPEQSEKDPEMAPPPMDFPDRFLHDVRDHEMRVVHDSGLHRHLTFHKPGTSNLMFHLTTWPGFLAISGDCDDFMFRRLDDMFTFFRPSGAAPENGIGRLDIGYWASKVVAASRTGGLEQFSAVRYKAALAACLESHLEALSQEDATPARDAFEGAFAGSDPMDAHEAIDQAMGYTCPVTGETPCAEFWDYTLTEPSYGFVWACHAIRWGIARYDAQMARRPAPAG